MTGKEHSSKWNAVLTPWFFPHLLMAVLEDIFTVTAVDPDGKVFDRGKKLEKRKEEHYLT